MFVLAILSLVFATICVVYTAILIACIEWKHITIQGKLFVLSLITGDVLWVIMTLSVLGVRL